MKLITIIGARPQFIKSAMLSRAIRKHNKQAASTIHEVIIHTGQHFDKNMSDVFFSELDIPKPDYNLAISNLSHGAMTGRMLESIENILKSELPDIVVVYGDTNSTLAGVLAAIKLHIPVAHVEAGLRSFNMKMPEEVNRILTDRVSNYLFCPTKTAVDNLYREGISSGVYNVGDVMYDATLYYKEKAKLEVPLSRFCVKEKEYVLCTIHRAENTEDQKKLSAIMEALRKISQYTKVVFPIHPRTIKLLQTLGKEKWLKGITVVEPVSYLEMLRLEQSALVILTDSGGVQKEAFFNQTPCITLREETEWIETVDGGLNQIVGSDKQKILDAFKRNKEVLSNDSTSPYGTGNSSELIIDIIQKVHNKNFK